MTRKKTQIKTGLDILVEENFARLKGNRIAVLAHQPSVDSRFIHIIDLLSEVKTHQLIRVFAPEHGIFGAAQDMIPLKIKGKSQGIPLVTLYGDNFESLWPAVEDLSDIDILIVDLQDVGSRYYTYFNTLAFCMDRARDASTKVIVLDRPNPIGGIDIEGTILKESMQSFVGYYPIASRHGMTIGELALLINDTEFINADLEVIPMQGWKRSMHWPETGLQWILPSPNMPTYETALVYPGGCLIEGTNLSEGRGTTKPFELIGAPFIDTDKLIKNLKADNLPGVAFRPISFMPTFQKWAGELCNGIQIHVTDAIGFMPWLTYTRIIQHILRTHEEFKWRSEEYEFVSDRLAIDLLFGDDELSKKLETDIKISQIAKWDIDSLLDYDQLRQDYFIYT